MSRDRDDMPKTAIALHLRHVTESLNEAVVQGDMAAVERCDHDLRSAVIALVGGASLAEDGAEERLKLLIETLHAVSTAAATLEEQALKATRRRRENLVYLKGEKLQGRSL